MLLYLVDFYWAAYVIWHWVFPADWWMELTSVFSRLETQLKFKSQGHADPSPSSVSSFWSADAFLRLSARSAFNTGSEVKAGQGRRIPASFSSASFPFCLSLFLISACKVFVYFKVQIYIALAFITYICQYPRSGPGPNRQPLSCHVESMFWTEMQ